MDKNIESAINAAIIALTEKVGNVRAHMAKSCANALQAGAYLHWLWENLETDPSPKSVPRGTLLAQQGRTSKGQGFRGLLDEIGVKKTTAYRWMNAWATACGKLEESGRAHPAATPLDDGWEDHLSDLEKISQGMSINRLLIGGGQDKGDVYRQEVILLGMESDKPEERELHEEVMEKVESGEYSLVDAMRAIGGATATKGQTRKDPVYLDVDSKTGKLKGLLPKALVTLRGGLARWDDMDDLARREFKKAWKELVSALPDDF